MSTPKKVLMVVTNKDRLDNTHPTGLWIEEFATPYLAFLEADFKVTVSSPLGGITPLDPRSVNATNHIEWIKAKKVLHHTKPLQEVENNDFDAIILPGGHGPMFDLAANPILAKLLQRFMLEQKLIGAICHGPAGLIGATLPNGTPLVAGRHVTGFTNVEEVSVHLNKLVPFLLETKLKELGAKFTSANPWKDHVVIDQNLITGQNPQSSDSFAKAIVQHLQP